MNNKIIITTAVVLIMAIGGLFYFTKPSIDLAPPTPTQVPTQQVVTTPPPLSITPAPTVTPKSTVKGSATKAPIMQIDKNKSYTADITTDKGIITVELFANKTPITVNNFVTLAKKGFYTNVVFHRVIKGFMIQGGDPTGTGSGGPGYTFADEPFDGEYTRGTLAMANAGPNTNGSQFFIMHKDNQLPKNYVIFGKVTKGIETVDAIAEAPVKASPTGENSVPVTPVKITKVVIAVK